MRSVFSPGKFNRETIFASSASPPAGGDQLTCATGMPRSDNVWAKLSKPTLTTESLDFRRLGAAAIFMGRSYRSKLVFVFVRNHLLVCQPSNLSIRMREPG